MDQILGISTVVTDDAGQRSRPIYRKMPGHKEIQLFRKDPPAPTVASCNQSKQRHQRYLH